MFSHSPPALLCGDPGRWPFLGHLRGRADSLRAGLALAGRVPAPEPGRLIESAWQAAEALKRALELPVDPAADRRALMLGVLQAVWSLPEPSVAALSLLLVSQDAGGIGVTGVGLGALWGLGEQGLVRLVPDSHPLLGPPGRPGRLPGVLTLDHPWRVLVACPAHIEPPDLQADTLADSCGWRP